MKTKLTILFILISTAIFSQKKFEATLTGGANYFFNSDTLSHPEYSRNGAIGFQEGIEVSVSPIKYFRIGAGTKHTTLSWKENNVPVELFEYGSYTLDAVQYYKLWEFPVYLQFELLTENKITPYIRAGYSFTNIISKSGKILQTDPPGYGNDFIALEYIYSFEGIYLYISKMHAIFVNAGLNYKLNDSFFLGINSGIKKYNYLVFDIETKNYTVYCNLTISYKFL
ncbi:MAG: hypothetical protein L3J35_13115 [Bacteroidales bacterium]|nr:hypothetical protein [Bacteroidales bacterium]